MKQATPRLPWVPRIAMALQRLGVRPPRLIGSTARRIMRRYLRESAGAPLIDGWDKPLIERSFRAATVDDSVPCTNAASLAAPAHIRAGPCQLRCLVVTSDLDAGGMDEVAAFLARHLPLAGVQTTVLHAAATELDTQLPDGRLGRRLLAEGLETKKLGPGAGAAWIAKLRPDVLSAHGAPAWVLDAAHRLSIPYVETLHGMHSLFGADWSAEAERGKKISRLIAVSDLMRRQYLLGNPAYPCERIITVPNGVDVEKRAVRDRVSSRRHLGLDGEFVFISLARHCLQKNAYALVSAFSEVAEQEPKAHLVIAGRPDDLTYFSQVKQLRAGMRCRDRIHLRDHSSDTGALLAASDGFVLNSFFEGWALASMEAICAGVPVIASEVGGALEQVGERGARGIVIPNPLGDPMLVNWQTMRKAQFGRQFNREALVAAMSSLIRNRDDWASARSDLIAAAGEQFSAQVCLRAHASVLAAAANQQRMVT
jgi:glycosyltransferase involved in cell wall biosynthesis